MKTRRYANQIKVVIFDYFLTEGITAFYKASIILFKAMESKLLKINNMETCIPFINEFISTYTNISHFRKQMNSLFICKDIIDKIRESLTDLETTRHNELSGLPNPNPKCDMKTPVCSHIILQGNEKSPCMMLRTNDMLHNIKLNYMGVSQKHRHPNTVIKTKGFSNLTNTNSNDKKQKTILLLDLPEVNPKERSKSLANREERLKRSLRSSTGRHSDRRESIKELGVHTQRCTRISQDKKGFSSQSKNKLKTAESTLASRVAEKQIEQTLTQIRMQEEDNFPHLLSIRTPHICKPELELERKETHMLLKKEFFSIPEKIPKFQVDAELVHKSPKSKDNMALIDNKDQLSGANGDVNDNHKKMFEKRLSLGTKQLELPDKSKPRSHSLTRISNYKVNLNALLEHDHISSFENIRLKEYKRTVTNFNIMAEIDAQINMARITNYKLKSVYT